MPESGRSLWWPDRKGLVTGVLVALIVAAITARFGFLNREVKPVSASSVPIETLQDEVAAREFWQRPPNTFAIGSLERPSARAGAAVDGAVVLTPMGLYREGGRHIGQPVYLVGRVIGDGHEHFHFLPQHEIELRGYSKGFETYLATDSSRLEPVRKDELVYALGYMAAKGTGPQGRPFTYFVAIRSGDATDFPSTDPIYVAAQQTRGEQP